MNRGDIRKAYEDGLEVVVFQSTKRNLKGEYLPHMIMARVYRDAHSNEEDYYNTVVHEVAHHVHPNASHRKIIKLSKTIVRHNPELLEYILTIFKVPTWQND